MTRSAMAATIAALAACGDGQIGSPISAPTGTKAVKVSDFPALATVGTLVVIDDQRIAKRTGTSAFEAFSRVCTHQQQQVDVVNDARQVVASGTLLHCFGHGSEFDANGNVTVGPATQHLNILATAYDSTSDMLTIG